ncbi:HNH endonuclease [Bosea sp. (in: a-proteobacteria)]|uniref:HNH endonuclease n=1 Tax=Bosea sp. (in: a-proteobacteria) TaxID=1871050 RepID=UPI001AC70160|nr:HNH endonuclease [Bosea sp. (in: a-proteobacteria)]MBN9437154.1 HNH endonuclease [Bosea sp. (in: a-proteobacteria)]
MRIAISDDDGNALDAKIDVEPEAIILHSRGGARGKPNERNTDYRPALRTILTRLYASDAVASGVWLDSTVARQWPMPERQLVNASDFDLPVDDLISLIGRNGSAKGQAKGTSGGNSTKRILIGVPGRSATDLLSLLGSNPIASREPRLTAEVLRRVAPEMIDEAVEALEAGAAHAFGASKDYDVLSPSGIRLPPKAVFGIALEKVIGRPARPTDFSAGWRQPCFDIIQDAGYDILAKDDSSSFADSQIDDEDSWTEGHSKLGQHRRRERKPGRARLKKRRFIEEHGYLFCERCRLVPTPELGPFGDACIEVHHTVSVAEMDGKRPIRLRDLQCLCANCHRIVHREIAHSE